LLEAYEHGKLPQGVSAIDANKLSAKMDVNVKKVNEVQEFYAGGTHYNNWNPQDRDSLKKQL
jgi:hypothetical protein